MNIGGAVVENQAVGVATAVSRSFVQDLSTDGLMGLAFGKINTGRFDSLLFLLGCVKAVRPVNHRC